MLDSVKFDQRREKVAVVIERAKLAMMTEADDHTVRPLVQKIKLIERNKPVDTIGPTEGANQVPFALMISAQPSSYFIDLIGTWIDEIDGDAMVAWVIEWVKNGISEGKLPSRFRIEATKDHPGQDEYGNIIPKKR